MPEKLDKRPGTQKTFTASPSLRHPGKTEDALAKTDLLPEVHGDPTTTKRLERMPTLLASNMEHTPYLDASTMVVFQIMPSGQCLVSDLSSPAILGRGPTLENEEVTDLSPFSARTHGVSRQHCHLTRQGNRLIVTDLGSTNGTFVNNIRLIPNHVYTLSDNDMLVLGTLHILVCFMRVNAPPSH